MRPLDVSQFANPYEQLTYTSDAVFEFLQTALWDAISDLSPPDLCANRKAFVLLLYEGHGSDPGTRDEGSVKCYCNGADHLVAAVTKRNSNVSRCGLKYLIRRWPI